jgi:hypothetical protein
MNDSIRFEDMYQSLPKNDPLRVEIDRIARMMIDKYNQNMNRIRSGQQGLGELGARELACKLAQYIEHNDISIRRTNHGGKLNK